MCASQRSHESARQGFVLLLALDKAADAGEPSAFLRASHVSVESARPGFGSAAGDLMRNVAGRTMRHGVGSSGSIWLLGGVGSSGG
uniref:Uncharacterized protein n=1 Tax=Oryza brachyantha TaxID=4533 RepID=J3MTF6_ORYBR